MSYDLNNISIIGRLTKKPELKETQSGKSFINFSIANNPGNKDSDTYFFDVTVWEKSAENVNNYLHKGSLVAIVGSLRQNRWEDNDGNKRSRVGITASSLSFINSQKKTSGSSDEEKEEYDSSEDMPF